MVSELGIIDWFALIVAAVLLAAAVAAAVIAMWTMQHRRRISRGAPPPPPSRSARRAVARSTPPRLPVIDLRTDTGSSDEPDPEAARASRADQLRKRPVPEIRPSVLDAPTSAKMPALASRDGRRSNGFALRGPGFFEDPIGRHEFRYWDGSRWTEHVKEDGQRFIDPL